MRTTPASGGRRAGTPAARPRRPVPTSSTPLMAASHQPVAQDDQPPGGGREAGGYGQEAGCRSRPALRSNRSLTGWYRWRRQKGVKTGEGASRKCQFDDPAPNFAKAGSHWQRHRPSDNDILQALVSSTGAAVSSSGAGPVSVP